MAKYVRIGVIGLRVGGLHLQASRHVGSVRAVAICDRDEAVLARFAEEQNVPRAFTDYREMLALDDLDAVVVALPNFLHESVVRECLRAGKHVLCEKPPALDAALAEKMHDEARRRKRLLTYGFQRRCYPSARYAKRFIDKGRAGEIYYAKAGWLRRRVESPPWFLTKKLSGGGPLIDLGVHHLDLVLWLVGYPKPRTVLAMTATKFGDYDVEDFSSAFIRFAGGFTLHLENSRAAHIDQPRIEYLRLLGDKAGLSFNPLTIHTDRRGKPIDDVVDVSGDVWGQGLTEQMRGFARRILKGDLSLEQARQGVTLMRIVDAIYTSARTGKAVDF